VRRNFVAKSFYFARVEMRSIVISMSVCYVLPVLWMTLCVFIIIKKLQQVHNIAARVVLHRPHCATITLTTLLCGFASGQEVCLQFCI